MMYYGVGVRQLELPWADGPVARPRPKPVTLFQEVPLNYQGEESTVVLSNGSSPIRVVLHTAVRGREIREFCLQKGWRVAGCALVVTRRDGQQKRYDPARADRTLVTPLARQCEWVREAGEKG